MASSSGSLNTSANNSNHHMFSSSQFMSTSFTDLLSPNKQEEEEEETMSQPKSHFSWGMNSELVNKNIEIPRYKSFPPSSLPLSPPPVSPSSYLSIPPSLSPSILLDSPVLFSSSNVLPSPTTGSFATTKEDERKYSDFSFQSQTNKPNYNSMDSYRSKQEDENFNSFMNKQGEFPTTKALSSKPEQHSSIISQENFPIINGDSASQQAAAYPPQQSQYVREQRKSDDGYNWRKYGQKQVKGSENPRSYFKCTFPNCPTKKKVERNLDGHITEIVYKGSHNHPKPQSTRRSSSNALHNPVVYANMGMPSTSLLENDQAVDSVVTTPENSSTSFGEDEFEQGSSMSNSRQDDENEPEADYFGAVFRKGENDSEGVSAAGSRTVREPRIVVQTTSDIDILDDGCFNVSYRASNESSSNSYMTRWTLLATWVDHFGKTSTGANKLLIELVVHSCRSYYKCTFNGCPVRKHVERASHDLRAVITTYEGKHNHDVPAARGSGSYAMTRPPTIPSNGVPTTIRPAAMTSQPNGMHYPNPTRSQTMQNQTPYTLQMLQDNDSYAFSNFGNSVGPYSNQMQQQHTDNSVSIAKQEPKDDPFFGSFLS